MFLLPLIAQQRVAASLEPWQALQDSNEMNARRAASDISTPDHDDVAGL
jgi:hypothetical protein